MPVISKYQRGKIYTIRSPHTDKIYIGSTINTLPNRFMCHKSKSNKASSLEILECGDAYIELLEMYPCQNRAELNRREGERIRENSNCVNQNIAGRTHKEWKVDNPDYRKNNPETYRQAQKRYQEKNKDKYSQKHTCPCGGKYSGYQKEKHEKTQLHRSYIATL